VLEGNTTQDFAATDAVDAWNITTGSTGIVIADVDTGVRFDHPDLLRAGSTSLGSAFGGRLLPGYDFVGEDYNPKNGDAARHILISPTTATAGIRIRRIRAIGSAAPTSEFERMFSGDTVEGSSWHGTRVVGVYGALTNNGVGVAGMSWGPWILPVRALGKGGGYDSDIMSRRSNGRPACRPRACPTILIPPTSSTSASAAAKPHVRAPTKVFCHR
jgi:serine protease